VNTNGHKQIDSLDSIAEEYLLCRVIGHNWQTHDVRVSRKLAEIHRILKCRTCSTLRVQVLTLDGYPVPSKSHYVYPEQQDIDANRYVLKGVGHLSADDRAKIRVMSTQQMKATQQDWKEK
jgi:hypothetical protein